VKERNRNNSIIFLTTLSVYLGLVLVGGVAPTVLAQAATTRNFNVQDEIEVKDDLDKKPEDLEIEISLAKALPAIFGQLLAKIKNEVESGKFSPQVQTNFIIDAQYATSNTCTGSRIGSDILNLDLQEFIGKAINEKFESNILKVADFGYGKSKSGTIRIKAEDANFSLQIFFTKSNAEPFAALLNKEFSLLALSAENALSKQLYKNTKSTFQNNQVFIASYLPRGSLDELLKQDAKAENQ
jgi:hypothetical protein